MAPSEETQDLKSSNSGVPVQLTKSAADVKSAKCNQEYPTKVVVGLAVLIFTLMVPLVAVFNQIRKLNQELDQPEETEFATEKPAPRESEMPLALGGKRQTDELPSVE